MVVVLVWVVSWFLRSGVGCWWVFWVGSGGGVGGLVRVGGGWGWLEEGVWVCLGGWGRVVGDWGWLAEGLWVIVGGWRRVVGDCGWLAQGVGCVGVLCAVLGGARSLLHTGLCVQS